MLRNNQAATSETKEYPKLLLVNTEPSQYTQMSRPLTPEAESFRVQIKDIISKADDGTINNVDRLEARDGRILYVGVPLSMKIGDLMKHSGLSAEWGFTVFTFSHRRAVQNPDRSMWLVPLSDRSELICGGSLKEGSLTHVTEPEPIINSGSTVIVFMKFK
ncbi:hypothetical protein BO94DRAFT_530731 [Aspergillus sclerotioniger CBS 115572]|uniref:Uncharacterized protein n=1 Tax=Aspergillus sclerotioniger CBS 115572 TaxID=1450535 RepID=A0A317XFT9_9EURO|nr:hypothetical protein BO94DRAFT_530731 [Aspergillus sclerotioniger CBS 115572]PWY96008.1 hypothetical protein BO94DRAFT_530731 [Aspergillus sclerotioniger CBS 115572]